MPANHESAKSLVAKAVTEGRMLLGYAESYEVLEAYDIPGAVCERAANEAEAIAAAERIGFPVVLKVDLESVVHKSDVGGVALCLRSPAEVADAYRRIGDNLQRNGIDGGEPPVAVQAMIEPGVELIVGMKRDPQFGPVIMFGMGGTIAEVVNDTAFRIAPLERRDIEEMISETRGRKMVEGYRGAAPIDREALIGCIARLSDLSMDIETISEIDLNPVKAFPGRSGIQAVDVRILLGGTAGGSRSL